MSSVVSPTSVPAPQQIPQKKHAPGILKHVSCLWRLVICCEYHVPLPCLGSPSTVRLCGCLRCLGNLRKKHALEILEPSYSSNKTNFIRVYFYRGVGTLFPKRFFMQLSGLLVSSAVCYPILNGQESLEHLAEQQSPPENSKLCIFLSFC